MDGMTINLGRSGALVRVPCNGNLEQLPQLGDSLELELPLPIHKSFGPRCVYCRANTVMLSQLQDEVILALEFEHIQIRKRALDDCEPASRLVM